MSSNELIFIDEFNKKIYFLHVITSIIEKTLDALIINRQDISKYFNNASTISY